MTFSKWKSELRSVFITASFGAVGWLITHIVDRIISTPAVHYKVEYPSKNNRTFSVILENITRNQHFDDVKLIIRSDICGSRTAIDNCFTEQRFFADEPYNIGGEPGKSTEVSISYNIARMMPGSKYTLSTNYSGNISNKIFVTLDSNKSTIKFIDGNIETYIAKNEIKILSVILLFWIVALFGIYRF